MSKHPLDFDTKALLFSMGVILLAIGIFLGWTWLLMIGWNYFLPTFSSLTWSGSIFLWGLLVFVRALAVK